ncbi:MAG: hypothetical protein CMM52_10525 [Rhodospirillaceae bacterium]|nr:hypothetical protein [Rhodospirillaceae bacterium]|tara:strand:- start:2147 stop:2440 length:294 start_codon:yes stop_codon:yes gene_type:complete
MLDEERHKRKGLAKTFPESEDWQDPAEELTNIKIDHPLYHHAPKISVAIGILAAIAIFIFRGEAPWWMPVFAGGIVAAVMFRLLRPRLRHPSIEDEI